MTGNETRSIFFWRLLVISVLGPFGLWVFTRDAETQIRKHEVLVCTSLWALQLALNTVLFRSPWIFLKSVSILLPIVLANLVCVLAVWPLLSRRTIETTPIRAGGQAFLMVAVQAWLPMIRVFEYFILTSIFLWFAVLAAGVGWGLFVFHVLNRLHKRSRTSYRDWIPWFVAVINIVLALALYSNRLESLQLVF